MPNHITNNIRFSNLEKFKELAVSVDKEGKEYIDFNKLIPMPVDLQEGNFEWETVDRFGFGGEQFKTKMEFQNNTLVPFLVSTYNSIITRDEFIDKVREKIKDKPFLNKFKELYGIDDIYAKGEHHDFIGFVNSDFVKVIGGFFNQARYSHQDWYKWSIENWGTKWNAYDCYINEDCATFSTAWACPKEWLQALAEHMDFKCSWADEDIGSNLGIGTATDGMFDMEYFDDVFDNYLEKQYLAIIIRGNDYEEEMSMYDEWEDEPVRRLPKGKQRVLDQVVKDFI